MEKTTEEITLDRIRDTAKGLAEGHTLRDLKGLTDGEMEAIYSLGYNFYTTGRLDDADKVFRFLVLIDHTCPKYWIGLGAVQQVKRDYKHAITSYAYASFLDIDNPKPQYHAAECFLATGDKVNALSALDALDAFAPKENEVGRLYRAKAEALRKIVTA